MQFAVGILLLAIGAGLLRLSWPRQKRPSFEHIGPTESMEIELARLKERYVAGEIDLEQFEARVEHAFRGPRPKDGLRFNALLPEPDDIWSQRRLSDSIALADALSRSERRR